MADEPLTPPGAGQALACSLEVRTLWKHDTEALACGRFHNPPGFYPRDALRAAGLQSKDLGFDVVGLYVNVDAARMLHRLDHYRHLLGRTFQSPVIAATRALQRLGGPAERCGPEACGSVEILRLAIDDDRSESALVHGWSFQAKDSATIPILYWHASFPKGAQCSSPSLFEPGEVTGP